MATQRWRGDAPAVAQVSAATITAYDVTTTYSVTINGKAVSVLGQGGTAATTAAALQTALAASAIPEFTEVTWSVNSATITGAAKTAGTPFTCTSGVSGGTGTFGAFSTSTASAGPMDWSTAANWSTGSVPVNGDDVYFDQGSNICCYGLAQSGVTLSSLTITQAYSGKIGLPVVNSSNTVSYFEYRPTYLQISATTLTIGNGTGSGSGRIKIDVGSNQASALIRNSGSAAETGIPSILLLGTHASNTLEVSKGNVGVAFYSGETSTIATLRVGYVTDQSGDSTVVCGAGATLTTIIQSGGSLTANSACTTLTQNGGDCYAKAGNIGTATINAGNLHYLGTGTITTLTVGASGFADFTEDLRARTITNAVTLYKGAKLWDPNFTVTYSGGFTFAGCQVDDVDLELGAGRTFSTVA